LNTPDSGKEKRKQKFHVSGKGTEEATCDWRVYTVSSKTITSNERSAGCLNRGTVAIQEKLKTPSSSEKH